MQRSQNMLAQSTTILEMILKKHNGLKKDPQHDEPVHPPQTVETSAICAVPATVVRPIHYALRSVEFAIVEACKPFHKVVHDVKILCGNIDGAPMYARLGRGVGDISGCHYGTDRGIMSTSGGHITTVIRPKLHSHILAYRHLSPTGQTTTFVVQLTGVFRGEMITLRFNASGNNRGNVELYFVTSGKDVA